MKKGDVVQLSVIVIILLVFLGRYHSSSDVQAQTKKDVSMRLTSPHFKHNTLIASRFTCEGENISPSLEWNNVPNGTKSFVLIVDDPDAPDPKAPKMTWVHWVVFNLPADKRKLEAGERIPDEQLGVNDFQNKKQKEFGGPCPPIGEHRYFFKLYALDTMLDLASGATKEEALKAMEGHVLVSGELVGLYQKK